MNVKFWDLEGQSISQKVASRQELAAFFGMIGEREPFFCEFVENGFKLSVCIRHDLGSVQHSDMDNMPPYLMAVNSAQVNSTQELDFFIGSEATSLLARYALPLEAVKEIIDYFFMTGLRSPLVPWEEV